MKKKFKFIALALAVVMASSLFAGCKKEDEKPEVRPGFPDYVGSGVESDFSYDQFESYITILKYTGTAKDVVVPKTIKDLPVTSLADRVFSNDKDENIIHTISIPGSVTTVTKSTFYNSLYLEEINVDADSASFVSEDGILYAKDKKSIWGYPENKSDREFTVPEGITEIRNNQFAFCKNLEKINLPSTLKTIGDFSFHGSINLKEIIIPEGTTSVGSCAFFACNSLERVVFPKTITSISANAFTSCIKLTTFEGYAGTPVKESADQLKITYKELPAQ